MHHYRVAINDAGAAMKWADENQPRKFPRDWPVDPLWRRFNMFGHAVGCGAIAVLSVFIGSLALLIWLFV